MKPQDIIVGQKYKHKNHPGVVYLGSGHKVTNFSPYSFNNKQLVIIETHDGIGIGTTVTKPNQLCYPRIKGNNSKGSQNFWDRFVPFNP